ncbi:right-handed parallel beta-helix repeat-containing protein [Bifidobacterium aerophilum]|uniref:DUF1565 domain-containing protein n=1 Tax=Bifidobacterium aerophilum TaxID=1798155 RepID=A0A6N9Z8C6_9BIFI|nr:right-handed parallel beta-helix repeat-containing protein [Bifidobacterium aerophilum]NEG90355.1 DUF1565 domain-containing protein [Bifidobacterium aerophilum]
MQSASPNPHRTHYHVAPTGHDHWPGDETHPFRTISHAARIAMPGDEVIVHAGEYREQVDPRNGGTGPSNRIVYRAAYGERPVIKGSERISSWVPEGSGVWSATLPNTMFGSFNPYARAVEGDWLMDPDFRVRQRHLGAVYLNGRALYEADDADHVSTPQRRTETIDYATGLTEPIADPDWTTYVWYATVDDETGTTTIRANFHDTDPNTTLTEINVRESCFWPSQTNVNWITVRGFEMAQAAGRWSPPTGDQRGMIGPNWSHGWIIENNLLHDAKCSAICLGKTAATGDNERYRSNLRSGYQCQMEAVFRALRLGWRKGIVGSHIVRGNVIRDCGQNGVVGHMGAAFSVIEHNDIARIGILREFFGWEIAGIKLHAGVDATVRGNRIHECTLGMWSDWQTQGMRITGNVFHDNTRDLMIEISHGPYLVDNNVFASPLALINASQGGAYVNNLFAGAVQRYDDLTRSTPYHFPHTTDVAGTACVYGGDDRWIGNLFIKPDDIRVPKPNPTPWLFGTASYNGLPSSEEEYTDTVAALGPCDEETLRDLPQPAIVHHNAYLNGAQPMAGERDTIIADGGTVTLTGEPDSVDLTITLNVPGTVANRTAPVIATADLGMPRIVQEPFESPDGLPITIDTDVQGADRNPEHSAMGPFATLHSGRNEFTLTFAH